MSCAHMGSLTSSSSKDLDSMIFLSRFSSSARISAISPSAAWHEVTHCLSERSYRHFLLGRSRPGLLDQGPPWKRGQLWTAATIIPLRVYFRNYIRMVSFFRWFSMDCFKKPKLNPQGYMSAGKLIRRMSRPLPKCLCALWILEAGGRILLMDRFATVPA